MLALTAGACGSEVSAPAEDPTVPVTDAPTITTEPSSSTEPHSTPPVSTTLPSDTTTTEPVVSPGLWDPPCIERSQPAASPVLDEAALATFGPLGPEPVLDIDVPSHGPSQAQSVDDSVQVSAARIPGGLLLLLRPSAPPVSTVQLVAVDDDGSVRWVRCLPDEAYGVLVAPANTSPELAIVYSVDGGTAPEPGWQWRAVRLDDGTDGDVPREVDGRLPLWPPGASVLLGPLQDSGRPADPATDDLVLVDLTAMTSATVPLPPLEPGTPVWNIGASVSATGVPFAFGSYRQVSAVYLDGAWSDDPGVIDATLPMTVEFDSRGEPPWPLDGRTASGEVVWTRDDLTDIGGEGFRQAPDGDVTVVAACIERASEYECTTTALVGIDTATGATVWQRDGARSVQAIGDGFAIVVDGSGYLMIDSQTGEPEPGQRWDDPGAFAAECCGGGDFVWVQRVGGVVFAHDYGRVRVWYPLAQSGSTRVVTLDL